MTVGRGCRIVDAPLSTEETPVKHFVKLYSTILTSSIWAEDMPTRIVWITMLTLADETGFVRAAPSGLARTANVPMKECMASIKRLEAPDLETGTQEYGGRRIDPCEGGWMVLNYNKYRDFRTHEQVLKAERQKRWRDGKKPSTVDDVDGGRRAEVEVDVEVEGDVEENNNSTVDSTALTTIKRDSATWIEQAMQDLKPSFFVNERILWEGRTVFAYWVWRRGKYQEAKGKRRVAKSRVMLTDDRKGRVAKWLKLYGLEDCLLAVEGVFHHPHMHQKDGGEFIEFENIFRPNGGGTLEKLRDAGQGHRSAVDKVLGKLSAQGWEPTP